MSSSSTGRKKSYVFFACLVLGVALVVTYLLLPWIVRNIYMRGVLNLDRRCDSKEYVRGVKVLGGETVACRKLQAYLSMDDRIAPKKEHAANMLAHCGREGYAIL